MTYKKGLGIPYMGSKRKIAKDLVDFILERHPEVDTVYDLFGGGGQMTFEFAQRAQIKKVIYNDFDSGVTSLMKKILEDGVTEEFYEWFDMDTFHELKNGTDWKAGLVKTCWSFGGNVSKGYLYSTENERLKKPLHEAIVYHDKKAIEEFFELSGFRITDDMLFSEDIQERRKTFARNFNKESHRLELGNIERLSHLAAIERLNRTFKEKLILSNSSYSDVEIPTTNNMLIYLDPPYEDTAKYQNDIDHEKLWDYVRSSSNKVYISSYDAPFPEVYSIEHRSLMSTSNTKIVQEKLFANNIAITTSKEKEDVNSW